MLNSAKLIFILAILIAVSLTLSNPTIPRVQVPVCPSYSRPMRRPDGEPRKCLPHQSNLCMNAVEDRELNDITSVCCWYNQVDYYCCIGVPSRECPEYNNITVVIHHNFPESPFPLKQFFFKKGIEQDVQFIREK